MGRLGVNIDHVATIRQARKGKYPDPVAAALEAERAGADNITAHLREDRRHIQERDIRLLREMIQTSLNLEIAANADTLRSALEIKPEVVTLVPERREELTTEGGLDLATHGDQVAKAVTLLREAGMTVSLFVDPDTDSVKLAHRMGAQAVEIHTGRYANAKPTDAQRELARIIETSSFAAKLRLSVHAGHGLNLQNIGPLAAVAQIESFQIGHAIISDALFVGIEKAVRQVKKAITSSSRKE